MGRDSLDALRRNLRDRRVQVYGLARSGIAAAALGETIFVFGGEAPEGTFDQVEAYQPRQDRWTRFAAMPSARHGLGAVALGGRIYVIAGGTTPGGSSSALNEIFTP